MRVFLSMVNKILASSSASPCMLLYIVSSINSVSFKSDNQYLVSRHSLYEIESLDENSALEIAPLASAILAPILVPLLSSCLERINSCFSELKY